MFESIDGTTFNGQLTLTIGGFNGNVRIDMKSGGKAVAISGTATSPFVVPGNLKITSTSSSFTAIALVYVNVHGNTDITANNGSDGIALIGGQYNGRVKIATGNGNDVVGTDLAPEFFGQVAVAMGKGLDYFLAFDSTFFNRLNLKMGSEADGVAFFDSTVAALNLNGNTGIDSLGSDGSMFILPAVIESVELASNPNEIALAAQQDTILLALVNLVFIVL